MHFLLFPASAPVQTNRELLLYGTDTRAQRLCETNKSLE